MGRNFDDYPGFQPKITPPKHFSQQCNSLFFKSTHSTRAKYAPELISKTPVSVNALKDVKVFYNVQYGPIALMEGAEDINAYVTETALLLVE